jgi:hypothetical protein
MAILDGALPKPNIPFLMPCTRVLPAHLTGTQGVIFASLPRQMVQTKFAYVYRLERMGVRSNALVGAAIAKGVGTVRREERAGPWQWYESDGKQIPGKKIVTVRVGLDCRDFGFDPSPSNCSLNYAVAPSFCVPSWN